MTEADADEAFEVYEATTKAIKALVAEKVAKLSPEQAKRVVERLSDEFRFW